VSELVRFLFEKTGHQVLELQSKQGEKGEELTLTLNAADINRFAGSEARLMRAFRGLLSASAAAKNTQVRLEVVEAA
jgi:predicted RNA-binding protein YlqC (UPF0109 family)